MDGPRHCRTEVISHRKTNIMCYHLNVKSKKGEVQMNLFTEVQSLM